MQHPSRTARMVAAYRALATERPSQLCNDPYARMLAGEHGLEDAAQYSLGFPYIELFVALRTAFFDEVAKRFLAAGFSQIVILGAGLDTRAARLGHPGIRFFEVDHPKTQADKLMRLRTVPGYPMQNAMYVPCDFARDDFVERLDASGFCADLPALFLWEGVTYYLQESAVRGTLSRIANKTHPRSVVGFDHVGRRMALGNLKDAPSLKARQGVAEMGEPLCFGSDHILPLLHEEGFRKASIRTFDELALNLTGTYDRARTFRFQYAVLASVSERL